MKNIGSTLTSLFLVASAIMIFLISYSYDFLGLTFILPIFLGLVTASLVFAIKSLIHKKDIIFAIALAALDLFFIILFSVGITKTFIDVFCNDNDGQYTVNNTPAEQKEPEKEIKVFFMDDLPGELKDMAKRDSEQYIESVLKDNKNAVKTNSGLIYEILTPGTKKYSPKPDDIFVMDWQMLTRSGIPAISLDEPDGVILHREFKLDEMMPGVAEGVRLINIGGKIKLYIPQHLIYKPEYDSAAQVQSEIILTVELTDIKPANGN